MEPGAVSLKTIGLATAGILAVEAILRWVAPRTAVPPLGLIAAARVIDLLWIAWVVHRWGPGARRLGIDRETWTAGLWKGCVWSAAFGATAAAGYVVLHLAGADPARLLGVTPARPPDLVPLLVTGGVIAPVVEEVYFRGLVFGWLRRWGVWAALLVSTALFAGLHSAGGGLPLTQLVGGIVFAAAYEIERNLLVPIIIHVLGNLALFTLPYLPC